jgi:hypothetical protein
MGPPRDAYIPYEEPMQSLYAGPVYMEFPEIRIKLNSNLDLILDSLTLVTHFTCTETSSTLVLHQWSNCSASRRTWSTRLVDKHRVVSYNPGKTVCGTNLVKYTLLDM